MQGQGNSSNSLPRTIVFGSGINVNNLGSNQHNGVLNNESSNSETIPIFVRESSNPICNNQNRFNAGQLLNGDGSHLSLGTFNAGQLLNRDGSPLCFGTFNAGQLLNGDINDLFHGNNQARRGQVARGNQPARSIALSLGNDRMTNEHVAFPGAGGASNPPPLRNMNTIFEGDRVGQNHDLGFQISVSGGSGSTMNNASSPVVISSGISGYLLEENDAIREGLINEARRISCKRRANEGVSRQLLRGSSSTSGQDDEDRPSEQLALDGLAYLNHGMLNSMASWNNHLMNFINHSELPNVVPAGSNMQATASSSPQQAATGEAADPLVLGPALDAYHMSSVAPAGQMFDFQRNTRSRIGNPPRNVLIEAPSAQTVGNPIQFSYQLNVVLPSEQLQQHNPHFPLSTTSAAQLPFMQLQNVAQTLQLSQLSNEVARLESVMSTAAPATAAPAAICATDGGYGVHLAEKPMNQMPFTMPHTVFASIDSGEMLANANRMNENMPANNIGSAGVHLPSANITMPANNISSAGVHLPSPPLDFPQPTMAEEAPPTNLIVNQPEPRGQGMRGLISSVATDSLTTQVGNSHSRTSYRALRMRAQPDDDSSDDDYPPPLSASRRRAVLQEFARMGGFFGVAEIDDDEDDYEADDEPMQFDLDGMDYEDILGLEAHMGMVNTGLSEETILANMTRRRYQSVSVDPPPSEAESCVICQDEYENDDDLGSLDCGHEFHCDCIKQWLVLKNNCPICKRKGLNVADD